MVDDDFDTNIYTYRLCTTVVYFIEIYLFEISITVDVLCEYPLL